MYARKLAELENADKSKRCSRIRGDHGGVNGTPDLEAVRGPLILVEYADTPGYTSVRAYCPAHAASMLETSQGDPRQATRLDEVG